MAYRTGNNAVLTDPPVPVSNSHLLPCQSSSPFTPSSTSGVSIDFQRHLNGGCSFSSNQASSCEDAEAFDDWTTQHPSALNMKVFDQMMNASKGKQIVVFLDYDGTLSPIVPDPDKAYMTTKMRSAVKEVAKFFPTAIISGRCLDKVTKFVQLSELYYAGSHGMDIMGPVTSSRGFKGNNVLLYQPASEYLPMMDKIFSLLVEKTKRINGAFVENNKFCVSVHFRRVEEKSKEDLNGEILSVIKDYPGFRLTEGKMVIEIRPPIKWDKGKALEFLLESLGLANCNDVLPLYIGDDRTDEDAFKVLRDRGQGYGILVSEAPRETSAAFTLKEPTEVMHFLRCLAKWKRTLKGGRLSKV